MTRRYPQCKKSKPIRCSARIRKLNMRPKLDVVFQNFPNVKRLSTIATNTADLPGKSSVPFENNDVPLESLSINHSTLSTDTKTKKGRVKKRVTHSRAVVNDLESSELLQENLCTKLSMSSGLSMTASAKDQKIPKKNSAILTSENYGLESPELFNSEANSSIGAQKIMSSKNSLILSMNSRAKRGNKSKKVSASVLPLENGSIVQSGFSDNVVSRGSSSSENISSMLFPSSSVMKNKKKEIVEQSASFFHHNKCTKSSELSNNVPVVFSLSENCSKSLPSLQRTRAKKGTWLREPIELRSFSNRRNLESPEIFNDSSSIKPPSLSNSINSDLPSINVKTKNGRGKEKSISIPLENNDDSQSFGSAPVIPVSLPIKNLKFSLLENEPLVVKPQNHTSSSPEMGIGNVEFKTIPSQLFESDDEIKRRNDAISREYEGTSSRAFNERHVSFGEENGSIDDLCSLFSDVELHTKGFQLRKKNEQNWYPESVSTSHDKPKSKTECKFCSSMYSHLPELNSNPETASYSKSIPIFHTNGTANLYDVDDSKELDIDIDSVLKSITRIEVRVPDYEPYTEGECWWEGFDEWSSS